MELEDRKLVCKVCLTQFARYICPRCNITYCSLPCYKAHSGGCTEAFYREQAVGQLQGTRAGLDERAQIMGVLKRAWEAQEEDTLMRAVMAGGAEGQAGESEEDGEGSDEEEGAEEEEEEEDDEGEEEEDDGGDEEEDGEEEDEQSADEAFDDGNGVGMPAAQHGHSGLSSHAAAAAARLQGLAAARGHGRGRGQRRLKGIVGGGGSGGAGRGGGAAGAASALDNLLSQETLRKLVLRAAGAGDGGDFQVSEADLSPEELRRFLRAVATGRLSTLLPPWTPWWEGPEARGLRLGGLGGGRLVSEVSAATASGEAAAASGTSSSAVGAATTAGVGSGGGGQDVATGTPQALPVASPLPALPGTPLQPLSALLRAPPSPLLQWVVLELLYAYCFVQRLYNGDASDAGVVSEAAETALAISPALGGAGAGSKRPVPSPEGAGPVSSATASTEPGRSSTGGTEASPTVTLGAGASSTAGPQQQSRATGPRAPPPPESARQALGECVARACAPPVGDASSRVMALGVVRDVANVLGAGPGAVVLALADLRRVLQAAEHVAQAEVGGAVGAEGSRRPAAKEHAGPVKGAAAKRTVARLDTAARKLWFFMCWVHEVLGGARAPAGAAPVGSNAGGDMATATSTSSSLLLHAQAQDGPALCAELSMRVHTEWQVLAPPATTSSGNAGAGVNAGGSVGVQLPQPGPSAAAAVAAAARGHGTRSVAEGPLVTPLIP